MDNTTIGYNDNAVIKTIYDPNPAGFKMPASNAFTGFTTNGQNGGPINASGTWDNGWNFNNKIISPDATVYFCYSKNRGINDGSLGELSCYWLAVPRSIVLSCHMFFNSWSVHPWSSEFYSRTSGFAVHPVSE